MSRAPVPVAPVLVGLVLVGLVLVGAGGVRAEPARYALDPEHTTVAFLVEHVGFARVLGRFTDVGGSFVWDAETRELAAVRVVVGTASVTTDHETRDKHVRGGDFLDVNRHPEMVFEAAGPVVVEGDGDGEGGRVRLDGRLSLLGETRPLGLDAVLNKSAEYPFGHRKQTLGVSARGTLRRSDYGMEYAVANGLVGDEVELIVELEALLDD